MSGEQLTGESLAQALESGALEPAPPAAAALVGMVKLSETPGCVAFTPAGCDAWVDVPTDMIESAQHIGERRCDDHRHPVVRMMFKEPASAEARVLRQLLAAFSHGSRPDGTRAGPARIPRRASLGWRQPPYSPVAPEARLAAGCHQFCDALLRKCIENPDTTSAQCVFLYENCWRGCDVIDWIGGIFDGVFEA
jgi:hypothetical protein